MLRSARHRSADLAAGCFGTHTSALTPPQYMSIPARKTSVSAPSSRTPRKNVLYVSVLFGSPETKTVSTAKASKTSRKPPMWSASGLLTSDLHAVPQYVDPTHAACRTLRSHPRGFQRHSMQYPAKEFRRIYLPKLFGKSGWVPNQGLRKPPRGVERAQNSRFLPPKWNFRGTFGYCPNSFSTHSGE